MLSRIEQLEQNVAYLEEMERQYSAEDIAKNKFDEWALRYGIFESIQIVIDIACHMGGKYNLGMAKSYGECIENLEKHHYLSPRLSKQLLSAIGLRNMLIHEYVSVDAQKLYGFLALRSDFADFIMEIKEHL